MAGEVKLPEPQATLTVPRPQKRTSGAGRSARRPEEDIPHPQYLDVLRRLGPRPGESVLAYEKRRGSISAGRALAVEAWTRNRGDKARVSLSLGIPRSSLAQELRLVGLDPDMLDSMLRGTETID